MSFRKVEAGRGIEWLKKAFALIMANPGVFLVQALIIGVLSAIPLINLVMIVIGPALVGGMIYSMREQDRGGTAEIGQLFAAFQQPGKIGPMLLLCVPAIVGAIVVGILFFIFGGAAIMGILAGANGSGAGAAAGLGGLFICLALGLVVGFLVWALGFFAVPRVMLDGAEPIDAMKDSLSASLANVGAMLVYGLVLFVSVVVLAIVIGWIPLLGILVLATLYNAVAAGAAYAAYLDVYGDASPVTIDYVPPPPSAPPPPPSM